MNTTLSIGSRCIELLRFPAQAQHPSLQAWGSEDELVLNEIFNNQPATGRTLLLNDEFGAIGCVLAESLGSDSVWQSDSFVAFQALKQNLLRNQLDAQFCLQNSVQVLNGKFDTVLLRLPKNHQYLEHQLNQLRHVISTNTRIIAFGKVKAVTNPILKLFESILGATKTSLAVKKSRLIYCTPSVEKLVDTAFAFEEQCWSLEKKYNNKELQLCNLANVFAAKQLDIGARVLLEHLPPLHDEAVIDLGCGNGVLGLVTLAQSEHVKVTFVDESYMAVESAKRAVIENLPEKLSCAEFVTDNCLDSVRANHNFQKIDRVLCNPPFHQQNTITDHIAWQMFNDAKACLKQGGKLWVVGNRHLAYHEKLKRIFGGVKTVASNAKFVILEAVKR